MKSIVFLIFLLMVSYVLNDYCSGLAQKTEDCTKLEKYTYKDGYCCLEEVEAAGQSVKTCVEISKDDYNNIKDYVSRAEKLLNNAVDYDIDCGSSYLSMSLLGLLLFLI